MSSLLMKWKRILAFALAVLFVFQTPLNVIADEMETEENAEEELLFLDVDQELLGGALTASQVIRGNDYTEDIYWILNNSELFITVDQTNVESAAAGSITGKLEPREPYEYGKLPWEDHNGEITSVVVGGDGDIVVPYYTARWFSGLDNLRTVSIYGIDTSGTVDMAEMFAGCSLLETLDLSALDTSNVTDMKGMFRGCETLSLLELDNFNTAAVTDYSEMFRSCSNLSELDVSMFDMSKGATLESMFRDCFHLTTLKIGKFFCESAEDLSFVFSGCDQLKALDLDSACTAAALTMEGMFEKCASLTELDLTAFVVKKVRNMDGMFRGCTALETVDLSSFNTLSLRSSSEMFRGCASFENIDLSTFSTDNLTDVSGMFYGCENLETIKMTKIVNLLEHKDLHDMFRDCSSLTSMALKNETSGLPADNVIVIDGSGVEDMSGMLRNCTGLQELSITMNMTNVPKVTDMLAGCDSVKSFTKGANCRLYGYKNSESKANLPNPSADRIQGADGYWYTTMNSKEVRYTSDQIPDEDSSVQYRAIFGTVTYDPGGFDVEPVVDYLKFGEQYTVKGNVFSVGTMLNCWTTQPNGQGSIVNINVTVDPSEAKLINSRLYAVWSIHPSLTATITWRNYNEEVLDTDVFQIGMMPKYTGPTPEKAPAEGKIFIFSGWTPDLVMVTEDQAYTALYEERTGKIQITWDTDNGDEPGKDQVDYGTVPVYEGTPVKTDPEGIYNYTFDHWEPEVTKAIADATYKAVYRKENKKTLYWGYENGALTISSQKQSGKAMSGNFLRDAVYSVENPAPWYAKRSQITSVTVGSAEDSVKPENLSCWFRNLEYAVSFDLTGLNASSAVDASHMFENCRRLTALDLRGLNTGKVKNFSCMLKNCSLLTSLKLTGLSTASATDMSGMFDGVLRLKTLDLTGFTTSGVTDFSNMFHDCRYMETLNVSKFNTSKAVTMKNMFSGCKNLKALDVSKFDTKKATNLDSMFENVALVKKLDLTGFAVDTAKTTTEKMFLGMLYLESITTGPVGDFTKASLPTPDGERIAGAHGYWIGSDNKGHKPDKLPANKADTYRVMYAKIYYQPNGASGSQIMEYMKCNASYYGIKYCPYTAPEGKYFAGWALNKAGTGTIYEAGQALAKKTADTLKGKTLYAVWKDIVTPTATIVWRDADGKIIQLDEDVPYGTVPSFEDTPPGKKADAKYTYTFAGWYPEIKAVDGDAEYSPTYTKNLRSYKVTWVNYDDTVLYGPLTVKYGTTVTYQGAEPKKPSDGTYTYEFKGWTPEVGQPIVGTTVYKAAFAKHEIPTTKKYHVTWKNYDNVTVLQEQDVAEGTIPTYTGPTPTQESDDTYTYTFAGWDPKVKAVYRNMTYVAKFSRSLRDYTVTYHANGHGKNKTVRTYVGALLTKPEDPVEEGWNFTGWYTTKDCKVKVDFDTYRMPAHAITVYAGWKKKSSGGGGGGGGGSVKSITVNQNLGGATFSPNWKQNAEGKWYITNNAGEIMRSCWLCDDAVAVNRCDVWYLLKEDGTMLDAGLVQDNTGNYYSLEMKHNGYYGRLRTENGWYDGIWLEFDHNHDGSYGAIKNQAGIEAMKAKYGVTRFNIGNESCVYTSSF